MVMILGTYTWCQEKYYANYHLMVGGGGAAGLYVGSNGSAREHCGVGGLRKFWVLGSVPKRSAIGEYKPV